MNLAKSETKTLYEAHYFVSRICASNFFFFKEEKNQKQVFKKTFSVRWCRSFQ